MDQVKLIQTIINISSKDGKKTFMNENRELFNMIIEKNGEAMLISESDYEYMRGPFPLDANILKMLQFE